MIPKKLGRFEILKEIGRGAMGQVFLANDPKIERHVAIKTIALPAGTPEDEAAETSQRFIREAQAAGRLLHPNIVTIFDVGEENGVSFIAMEYIDGVTLDKHARSGTLLPPGVVLDLVTQAAGALDHAHVSGVIHRDIKPANLMRLRDGTLKITDFGLAKNPSANLTQSGVLLGTPSYMSPEQIQGRELDGRSDLFSLGVVLYELLTGVRPFDADSISTIIYRVLYEDPRPPAAYNPALPGEVNLVIERLLAKDLNRRYATGAALVSDLRKAFSSLPPDSLSRPFPIGVPAPPSAAAATRRSAAPGHGAGHGRGAAHGPGAAKGGVGTTSIGGVGTRSAARRVGPRAVPSPPPAPTPLIAHHPFKIAALVVTVAAGLLLFPRWVNRAERGHRLDTLRERCAQGPGARDGSAPGGSAPGGGADRVHSAGVLGGAAPAPAAALVPAGTSGPAVISGPAARVAIDVETSPKGGALLLDDMPLAEPRVVLAGDDPRTHEVRGRSGCMEATAEVTAANLATRTGPLVLTLRPRKEVVTIGSQPAGARVVIDGRDTGKKTPIEMELDLCDTTSVELRLDGHRPWSREFETQENAEALAATLGQVALQPIPRGKVLIPKPQGYDIDVYEGSKKIGRSGQPITLLEGKHALTLRNDKVLLRENVTVTVAGDRTVSPAAPPPALGRLTVQAQPSNCKVFIDDLYVDVTPILDMPIAAGAHRVKVVFVPNGASKETTVSIAGGKAEKVTVRF